MQTLPEFETRDQCRSLVRKYNALSGSNLLKPAATKSATGKWRVRFRTGLLCLKKAS